MRLLGAVGLACAAAVAQADPARPALLRDLDGVVRMLVDGAQPGALSLSLLDIDPAGGEGWSWSVGVGTEDAERTRSASGATVYRADAMGAAFTATAVLALAGQGRLRDGTRFDTEGAAAAALAAVEGGVPEAALQALVFVPLGLRDSTCGARADLLARTAHAQVRGWDGSGIPVPLVLGPVAAGSLWTSTADLAALAAGWFPHGPKRMARAELLALPWPVLDASGLGFDVTPFEGHACLALDGSVQGTAVRLTVLPHQGLAVAAAATCADADGAVAATVDRALQGLLAIRAGRPLDPFVAPRTVGVEAARWLAGRYHSEGDWFDLCERHGELAFDPAQGVASRLRWLGSRLVCAPGSSRSSIVLEPMDENSIRFSGRTFVRAALAVPPDAPVDLKPLLGEYGSDHDLLVAHEDGGRLFVLLDRRLRCQTERESSDRFRIVSGPRAGTAVAFERDGTGRVVAATVDGARMVRRPEAAMRKFRITPQRPVAVLREEIRGASPPAQPAGLRASELVDLRGLDPTLRFDVRYATEDNFLGAPVYDVAGAMLQRPAAEALLEVHRSLAAHGLGLCIFDGYRPWRVTKLFWEATPPELREFVADPANGSRHNRGCAVDLTLCDLATGALVDMPSDFDEFTWRAYPEYPGGTARQRWYRELLRTAMEPHGFEVIDSEWWHFDFRLWREYPVLDEPLR